ncbi:C3a anaphylatoxin chemotactic receptor [Astyanax mexicanus]|uniref:C3a anaphylatoxin chemotactic receptor n=1 Tax=Astyanax mexicanus TaxID=7994 RepID=UPI0020CAFE50|nr:C3a anaphylatoxin chemotactic receptor [Astyanax mexicanus]
MDYYSYSDNFTTDDYNYTWENLTDYDVSFHEDNNHPFRVVSLVFYCLTCALGVPGNILVVWIAGLKMKRTVNTTWFLNLAIADLLCCLSIPFTVADILMKNHWPYGNVMCRVLPAVIVLNMFASVFTLNLIGLDRFVQVVKPVWSQNNRSLGLAAACCGLAWVLALLLSLPNMIFRKVITITELKVTICTFHSGSGDYEMTESHEVDEAFRTLTLVRFLLGFLIPLLSIAACYALIARKVSRSQFRSGRAFRIMVVVVVAFFLSWLPYHVLGLMDVYGSPKVSELAKTVDPLAISLAYVNSCMNPVLYVFMGQDFKEKVKLSLRRIFERAFSEDGTQCSGNSRGLHSQTTTKTSEAQI